MAKAADLANQSQPQPRDIPQNFSKDILPSPQDWILVGEQEGYFKRTVVKENDHSVHYVRIIKAAPFNSYPQLLLHADAPISAGSILAAHVVARSIDNLFLDVSFIKAGATAGAPPAKTFLFRTAVLTSEWQEYTMVFSVPEELAEKDAIFALNLPRKVGSLEIASVSLADLGPHPKPVPEDKNRYLNPFAGAELPESWWHEATRNIEKYRQRAVIVKVTSRDGQAVTGAHVQITQTSHLFHFGSAIASQFAIKYLANKHDSATYYKMFTRLFNCATPENALKWRASDYQEPGTPEKIVDWCLANDLSVRGHHLLAPMFNDLPEVIQPARGKLLTEAIHEHIKDYVRKFKGKVYVWDVINEGMPSHDISDLLGRGIFVNAYKWAHEEDPNVLLGYNDFDILNNRAGANDGRRLATAVFIRDLMDRGAPISSLGIQSHMDLPFPRATTIWKILDEWSAFKLPLEITEFDLPVKDDALQASYFEEVLTAVFSHPNVLSFVMWGFWAGDHFRPQEGSPFYTKTWQARPAARVYNDLVYNKWWTRATLSTDNNGNAATRVFLGTHRLQVTGKGFKKTVDLAVSTPGESAQLVNIVLDH